MPSLSGDDFLLGSATARQLYHAHAAKLPIVDYHSHVSAQDLADDRVFANLFELWLAPDQYKHRVLRALGVEEQFILGHATPREKFDRWAAAVSCTLGNPLYHWTALELRTYFGLTKPLSAVTAEETWQQANAALRRPSHRARALLARADVEIVCSSDRLLDDLSAHAALQKSGFGPRVLPSLRADDLLAVESPDFPKWLRALGAASSAAVEDLDGALHAVELQLQRFAARGCTVADHGIDVLDYVPATAESVRPLYARRLAGNALANGEAAQLRSFFLRHLAVAYARRGWLFQLHLGAQRQTSSRLRGIAGPAGGYATIGATTDIARLCGFLDELERAASLPRTILYTLNPADNAAFATLTGSFAQEGVAGKIQFGPAWWFNDHELGIRNHLETLAHHGLLWNFIGMTTDSRSLLSMSRHDYFRRVLCDYLGQQVERGAMPRDETLLAAYVRRICYENARAHFNSPGKSSA